MSEAGIAASRFSGRRSWRPVRFFVPLLAVLVVAPARSALLPPAIIPTVEGAGSAGDATNLPHLANIGNEGVGNPDDAAGAPGVAPGGAIVNPDGTTTPVATTAQLAQLLATQYGAQAVQTAEQLGVNPATIAAIAAAESNFQNVPTANGSTSATGPFQFTQGTFDGVSNQNDLGFSPSDITNPTAQAIAANFYVQQLASTIGTATGTTPTTLQVYGGYLFGPTAGAQLANATDNTPLSSIVTNPASLANNGLSGFTVGQFRTLYTGRLGAAANQPALS